MNARPLVLPLALTAVLAACASSHHAHATADQHGAMTSADVPAAAGGGEDAMAAMMAAMSPEDLAMMNAWMEFMTPVSQHAGLAATAGRWKLRVKHWMAPGAPPEESDSVAEFESFGDGRYLVERAEGNTPMGPFSGLGITGFNNRTGRFFNVWIDSMGTGLMLSEGEGDAHARTIHFAGTVDEPLGGGEQPVRTKRRMLDDDSFLFEMWMQHDGQEFKTLEITYRRA